ncbi:MAG: sulfotransferase family protein [Planctomycetes bacterium]|nr:sulfotransferase family protein [Planctomycetota bacterium]
MRPEDRDFVTIVSGLPRSGTSMVMSILGAGGVPLLADGRRAADEDNPRGYFEYEPVKRTREDPSWLEAARGKAVKMVYKLLYDLPLDRDYRVLFVRRRLVEVLASQDKMLARRGVQVEPMDLDRFTRLFGAEIERARGWLATRPRFAVLEVDYNAMLEDPGRSLEAIDRFLGGGLDLEAMRGAIDPSLYRQRRE